MLRSVFDVLRKCCLLQRQKCEKMCLQPCWTQTFTDIQSRPASSQKKELNAREERGWELCKTVRIWVNADAPGRGCGTGNKHRFLCSLLLSRRLGPLPARLAEESEGRRLSSVQTWATPSPGTWSPRYPCSEPYRRLPLPSIMILWTRGSSPTLVGVGGGRASPPLSLRRRREADPREPRPLARGQPPAGAARSHRGAGLGASHWAGPGRAAPGECFWGARETNGMDEGPCSGKRQRAAQVSGGEARWGREPPPVRGLHDGELASVACPRTALSIDPSSSGRGWGSAAAELSPTRGLSSTHSPPPGWTLAAGFVSTPWTRVTRPWSARAAGSAVPPAPLTAAAGVACRRGPGGQAVAGSLRETQPTVAWEGASPRPSPAPVALGRWALRGFAPSRLLVAFGEAFPHGDSPTGSCHRPRRQPLGHRPSSVEIWVFVAGRWMPKPLWLQRAAVVTRTCLRLQPGPGQPGLTLPLAEDSNHTTRCCAVHTTPVM